MKRNLIIRLILALLTIGIMVLLFFTFVKNKSHENIKHKIDTSYIPPVITEEFKNTDINVLGTYKNFISYDKDTKEIFTTDNNKTIIIGKYGKIYKNTIEMDKDVSNGTYGDYELICDDDNKLHFINIKTGSKSTAYECGHNYTIGDNNFDYIALYKRNGNGIDLLNYRNGNVKTLDSRIKYISPFDNDSVSEYKNNYINYLIAINEDNKFGLIDYNGNTILDFEYDRINNYINKNEYVACKDNKCGLIDSTGKVLLAFEYDDIIYKYNYKILIRGNTAAVMYDDKLVVDFTLPFDKNDSGRDYGSLNLIYNDKTSMLILITCANYPYSTQTYWDNSRTYLINNKGIVRKFDGYLETLYSEEDELLYLYNIYKSNQRYGITFYDIDLYEYFSTNVTFENNKEYNISIDNLSHNKYYYDIKLTCDNTIIHTYVDLYNSKKINEKKANYIYYNNGYAFTLVDGKLNIYKENEVIDTYNNITMYLGNYYYVRHENDKYEIVEIKFNKNDSE